MLCGALLTVRRMVKRPPLKLPIFLTSSFCGFTADSPTNADCWIAEVAIFVKGSKGALEEMVVCKRVSVDDGELDCYIVLR